MVRAVPCARLLRGDSPPDYIGCVTFHVHSLLISFAPRYFPFYPPSLAPDQTGRVHIHVQGLALRLSLRSPRVCIHQALTHQELHICWPHPLTTPTDHTHWLLHVLTVRRCPGSMRWPPPWHQTPQTIWGSIWTQFCSWFSVPWLLGGRTSVERQLV